MQQLFVLVGEKTKEESVDYTTYSGSFFHIETNDQYSFVNKVGHPDRNVIDSINIGYNSATIGDQVPYFEEAVVFVDQLLDQAT